MATYYFRNVGTNWGDAANWSQSDSTYIPGAVPLATDDAYFTSNSGNCTVNASARVCRTLIFSGVGAGNYAGTFTVSNNVTVSGNVTLSATMTIAGTSNLRIDATSTITSNGKTWTGGLTIVGNQTVTLSGNFTINGSFDTTSHTSGTVTINSNTLTIGGGLTSTLTSGFIAGTASIVLNGTGTLATNSATNGYIQNNLTINTSGTITFGTTLGYSVGTFTYTAGTVVTTGNTFSIRSNCTLDTDRGANQINFSTILITLATATLTLSSNLNVTNFTVASASNLTISSGANDLLATTMTLATTANGVITIGKNTQVVNLVLASGGVGRIDGAFNFSVSGNLTHNSTSNTIGSATIVLNGTGTWSHTSTGAIVNNLTINTAGTITLGTNVIYLTGTLTYTAGTVVSTGNTLNISNTTTLATNGMTWNNISYTTNNPGTITLSNNLTCSGSFTTSNTTNPLTLNGSTFTIGGNFTSSITSGNVGGTTNIVLNGTGTLSTNSAGAGAIVSNLTINTSGTITIGTVLSYNTRTLTYTSGTVVTTGSTLRLQIGGCTLATNGIIWNNIITTGVANAATYTLSNNLTCSGNLTILIATNDVQFNGSTLTIGGSFTADSMVSGGGVYGTTNIVMNGTGVLSTNSATINSIQNNLTINTTGTITLGTVFAYGSGTFTYLNGTVITSGNTLLAFGGTYNTNGIIWNNISNPSTANNTITLSSDMTCIGDFRVTNQSINTLTINGNTLNVGGSFIADSLTNGVVTGTTNILLNGNGILSTNSATTGRINNPILINTSGTITFGTILNYGGSSFTITRGRVNTRGNTLSLLASCTFSFKAINFNNVIITAGTTITMDEFFNGAPDQKATITSTTASNYTITFLDGFEKFAKFVNVNNATLTRRGQLLLITNQIVPSTNLGIRRINSFPNSVGSQGNFKPLYLDSVPPMGDTRLLTSDPAFN